MTAPTPDLDSSDNAYKETTNKETTCGETAYDETVFDETAIDYNHWLGQSDPTDVRFDTQLRSDQPLLQSNPASDDQYPHHGNSSDPTNIAPYQSIPSGFIHVPQWPDYHHAAVPIYLDRPDYTLAGPSFSSLHASFNSIHDASMTWDSSIAPNYRRLHEDPDQSLTPSVPSSASAFSAPSVFSASSGTRSAPSVFSASSGTYSTPSDTRSLTTYSTATRPYTERSVEGSKGGRFACDSCGSRFSTRKDRDRHGHTHNQQVRKARRGRPSLEKASDIDDASDKRYPEDSKSTESFGKGALKPESSMKTTFESGNNHTAPFQRVYTASLANRPLLSYLDNHNDHKEELCEAIGKGKDVEPRASDLSPSQESPQSDSESSSNSTPGLLTRDERKSFILDRLMSYFFELFASCPSPVPMIETTASFRGVKFAGAGGIPASSGNAADGTNKSSNAPDHGARVLRKRNHDKDEDESDRGKDRPCKITRVGGNSQAARRKLACPYFKKDPEYPQFARSCSGPGWDTVHRIKEHLDRNHALPPSCDRCYTAFKTDSARTAHLRSEIQCELRERPSRMQGFDVSQRDQLKSRPRGYKQMSEIQKWCHIYAILFPETDNADIPSPYYNYASFQDPGHPADLMVEYDRYLRREMPDRIRHQLGNLIENALNPVEETLRAQIPEMVREIQNALSESFRASIGITIQDSHSYPGPVDIGGNTQTDNNENNGSLGSMPRDASGLPNSSRQESSSSETNPEAFSPGPFPDNFLREFDWELFDLSSLVDLPETHASAHEILPMSRDEAENGSLLPRESSFV